MTYPSSFHLCCQHNHHRGALLPRHLPEVRASVGQRALARYVAVYQTGSRNLHLYRKGARNRCRDISSWPSHSSVVTLALCVFPSNQVKLKQQWINSVKYLNVPVREIEDMAVGLCSYLDFKFTFKLKKNKQKKKNSSIKPEWRNDPNNWDRDFFH